MGCQSAGHFQRPTGPLEAADATAVWLLEQHVKSLTPAARDTAHTAKADENHSPRGNTDIRTWGSQGKTQQGDQIPAGLGSLRKPHQGSPLLSETRQSPQRQ